MLEEIIDVWFTARGKEKLYNTIKWWTTAGLLVPGLLLFTFDLMYLVYYLVII